MPWCRNAIKGNLGISSCLRFLFGWPNWRLKIGLLDPERTYGPSDLSWT